MCNCEKVKTLEDIITGNLNDIWLKMYVYIARVMVEEYGIEGEAALRRGLRNFGHDRGKTLRNEQLALGMKINMYNLWTYYDLPGDNRFKRNKIRLNTQERISQTLVCPMANMWINMDAKKLGAIYCDEFHPAMFEGYNPKITTNLGETLTHDTDDHCHFALYLRPANMTPEERKEAFEEFDPSFDKNAVGQYVMRTAREGYNMLTIKLYYHLVKETIENFGEGSIEKIATATKLWARDSAEFMKERAIAVGTTPNDSFLKDNCPVSMNIEEDTLWDNYSDYNIKEILHNNFHSTFKAAIIN